MVHKEIEGLPCGLVVAVSQCLLVHLLVGHVLQFGDNCVPYGTVGDMLEESVLWSAWLEVLGLSIYPYSWFMFGGLVYQHAIADASTCPHRDAALFDAALHIIVKGFHDFRREPIGDIAVKLE